MNINTLQKIIITPVIIMLVTGYLGVNLFEYSRVELFLIRFFGLLLLCVLILINFAEIRRVDKSAVFFGFVALSGIVTSSISMNLFYIFIYLIASKGVDLQFQIKITIWVLSATVIMTLLLINMGYIDNRIDITTVQQGTYAQEYDRERMTFGYKNVNAFSSLVTSLCLLLFVSNSGRVLRVVTPLIISIYFFYLTDSRTLMAVIGVCYFIYMVTLYHPFDISVLRLIINFMFIVLVAISMFAALINLQLPILDEVFNGRLSYIEKYHSEIQFYQWIFGGAEPSINVSVDNAFALLMGTLGVPVFIWLVMHVINRINYYFYLRKIKEYSFCIGVLISAFGESSILRPELLVGLIFWQIIFTKIRYFNELRVTV